MFLRFTRPAALLATITAFACLAGCLPLQDTQTTRKPINDSSGAIRFVEVRDPQTGATYFEPCKQNTSTAKTLGGCSNVGRVVRGEARNVSSEKNEKMKIAQIVATPGTNIAISQDHAQTKAAIVFSKSSGMKMDNVFSSAKRIVPFSFSANGLGPLGKQIVAEIALVAKDADRIYVRGRTDSSGTQAKNVVLAKGRADAVRTMFVADGVPRSKVHATYCTTCFIATNATEAGRRLNRRVDVDLIMHAEKIATLSKEKYEIVQLGDSPTLDLQKDMQMASQ